MNAVEIKGPVVTLKAVITPKASRDSIIPFTEEEIKITVTAPPVDGKANQYLQKYLSKAFGTSKGKVQIIRGECNHHKVIEIRDFSKIPDSLSPLLQN
ncbi:DUF167 family protein [Succinimonas amylolytica]|uniref:DUF167 family protein n=1 Tax=Succinimonas amylolytica TaxID=83769 RepID=UPI0003731BB6|nr:DUF167 family protein [Succinimonas amylolytica]